jgi:hypothetical protein
VLLLVVQVLALALVLVLVLVLVRMLLEVGGAAACHTTLRACNNAYR